MASNTEPPAPDAQERLRELLSIPGVVGAGKWQISRDPHFHLVRYEVEIGDLSGPVGWWISNFSEINLMVTEAQTIDYDNETRTRSFHPPRMLLLRGKSLSLLTHANRVYAILDNARRPDVWHVATRLEEIL
jgi:roadblock/LC7 domain-containing protein